MKVLWLPQFSSVKNKFYYITSDSNWNFAANLLKGFKGKDVEFTFVLPTEIDMDDSRRVRKVLNDVKTTYHTITTNVFGTRFDFNYDWAECALIREMPDIVFENNPVHVRAWKTAITQLKIKTKVVTYFHWIDSPNMPKVPENISYWLRQIEGALTADLVLFNSDYARSSFIQEMIGTTPYYCYNRDFSNFKTLPPSLDLDLSVNRQQKSGAPAILFNHRLSSLDYYRKNYEMLVSMLHAFEDIHGWVPKTYFTNPSRKELDDFPFEHELLNMSFDEYNKFIGSNKVNIAPNFFMESKGMWSIASVEAGYMGNAVILPKLFGYAEIVPGKYNGYFDNKIQAFEIFERCCLDELYRNSLAKIFMHDVKYLNCSATADKLHDMFKELIQ